MDKRLFPDGFTVELVAGPPLVNRPISIDFDPEGRLYATDSSGLSDRAPIQFEQKPHRIVRLEATKNDGRFDRAKIRYRVSERSVVELYVGYLRRKLEAGGEPRVIHTVRGVGFVLRT